MQEYLQNFDDFQFGIHDNCINILFYFFRGRNYIRNNSFVCFYRDEQNSSFAMLLL